LVEFVEPAEAAWRSEAEPMQHDRLGLVRFCDAA
jgi:hypothetical protein